MGEAEPFVLERSRSTPACQATRMPPAGEDDRARFAPRRSAGEEAYAGTVIGRGCGRGRGHGRGLEGRGQPAARSETAVSRPK